MPSSRSLEASRRRIRKAKKGLWWISTKLNGSIGCKAIRRGKGLLRMSWIDFLATIQISRQHVIVRRPLEMYETIWPKRNPNQFKSKSSLNLWWKKEQMRMQVLCWMSPPNPILFLSIWKANSPINPIFWQWILHRMRSSVSETSERKAMSRSKTLKNSRWTSLTQFAESNNSLGVYRHKSAPPTLWMHGHRRAYIRRNWGWMIWSTTFRIHSG